jgi:hypothetical protein
MFALKLIGGALLPDELEMRNLIEKSLTKNNVEEQIYNANGINDNQQPVDIAKTNIETHQDLSQQHYESNCVVESKSYFGSSFASEKHNSELVYEDLPKSITEFNKTKTYSDSLNCKASSENKCKETTR